jgi:enoyl-CoA hydratase/carnithine racemase
MTSVASDSASLIDSTVLRVSQAGRGFLRAVIDNPPINLLDPAVFAGLSLLQSYVSEPANNVKVVVFESANPDFFCAHLDLAKVAEVPDVPGARNIVQAWPGFSQWLTNAPVVSIAKIRGRARGIGNEFICACDMRFASSENARLGQIEVGFGVVPGGGALEWLPRHIGRGRALEVVLGADDFDAGTAERYGWVNRALPDAQLDDYVDELARRIATFDAAAIATAKQLISKRQPTPSEPELAESFHAILTLGRGESAQRISALLRERAGGSLAPAELDLPRLYGR